MRRYVRFVSPSSGAGWWHKEGEDRAGGEMTLCGLWLIPLDNEPWWTHEFFAAEKVERELMSAPLTLCPACKEGRAWKPRENALDAVR